MRNKKIPDYSKIVNKDYPLSYFTNRISFVIAIVKWEVILIAPLLGILLLIVSFLRHFR